MMLKEWIKNYQNNVIILKIFYKNIINDLIIYLNNKAIELLKLMLKRNPKERITAS